VAVQSTVKWLEKDKQLLKMTENVDYDVEGTLLICDIGDKWLKVKGQDNGYMSQTQEQQCSTIV